MSLNNTQLSVCNAAPIRALNGNRTPYMSRGVVLDELAEALTNSSKVAASLGDEFLVYLINMAVLHVRKRPST